MKTHRIRKRKTRRLDVIRINGQRRSWRKENKKEKWKIKRKGTKEMGIKTESEEHKKEGI
jgi:hypothetical protein